MLNNELNQAMLYIEHEICCNKYNDSIFLYGMSNWVKFGQIKEKSWTMILLYIQNFCLATTAKCHILDIILMHTNLKEPKSAMPPLVDFSHAYDLEG